MRAHASVAFIFLKKYLTYIYLKAQDLISILFILSSSYAIDCLKNTLYIIKAI